MTPPHFVDEHALHGFRRDWLSPRKLLELVERHVRLIAQVAVGVGKSHAADRLLESPELYDRFDRVLYVAPTWDILRERSVVRGVAPCPVAWMALEPRPRQRCGALDPRWRDLEGRSCSALAKATLCARCPQRTATVNPCIWPEQFAAIAGHRLLLLPEQQLLLNRMLVPMVGGMRGGGRMLLILDEARLLHTSFEVTLLIERLQRFRQVIEAIGRTAAHRRWADTIQQLLERRPLTDDLDLPPGLHRDAVEIQRTGVAMFGDGFHNPAYELSLLGASRRSERWFEDGRIRFIGRPLLNCHVLALSANLTGEYAGDRLGTGRVASPFVGTVFRHSGTRIINLRSRIGAARYFAKNHKQILDTFAALIARNVDTGRSTLLVSKKDSKALCIEYLQRRLRDLGHDVQFVCEKLDELPRVPDPRIVPVIHYGVVGVNTFSDYEAAYCLNSFYISPETLSRAVQEASPRAERVRLGIASDSDRVRRPKVVEGADPSGVVAKTARIHLDKLEGDAVLQAVGRVRYATSPREVILFQMADFAAVGEHQVVRSLAELRDVLGVPPAGEILAKRQAVLFRNQVAAGLRIEQIAARAGVSERTVYRRLADLRAAKSPLGSSKREDGSQPLMVAEDS